MFVFYHLLIIIYFLYRSRFAYIMMCLYITRNNDIEVKKIIRLQYKLRRLLFYSLPLEREKARVGGDAPRLPLILTADTWYWYQCPGLISRISALISVVWNEINTNLWKMTSNNTAVLLLLFSYNLCVFDVVVIVVVYLLLLFLLLLFITILWGSDVEVTILAIFRNNLSLLQPREGGCCFYCYFMRFISLYPVFIYDLFVIVT